MTMADDTKDTPVANGSHYHSKKDRVFVRGIEGESARPMVVFISHRFSTVRQADTIVLLDEGRIRAEGSHEELIRSDAGYAELFEAQARWYR